MDIVKYQSFVLYSEISEGADREYGQQPLRMNEILDLSSAINKELAGQVMECTPHRIMAIFPRVTDALGAGHLILDTVHKARKADISRRTLSARVLLGYGEVSLDNGRLHSNWTYRMPRLISKVADHSMAAMQEMVDHVGGSSLQARSTGTPGLYSLGSEAAEETRLASAFATVQGGIFSSLQVKVRGVVQNFRPVDCPVLIGREKSCAIQLTSESSSRVHGRIEYENSKFLYVDQSRNGSYILTGSGEEIHLQQGESIVLAGDGFISPGASVSQQKGEVMRYSCHSTKLSLDTDEGDTRTLKS